MKREQTKKSDGRLTGKRIKNDDLADLIVGFDRYGLDIGDMVSELRRKYPGSYSIIKLSEALGLEPKRMRSVNNPVRGDHRQTGSEAIIGAAESGDKKAAASVEKYTSTGFYGAVGKINLHFINMKR